MATCVTDDMVLAGSALVVSDELRAVMTAVYVLSAVSLVINLMVFLHFKPRYARLKLRATLVMYMYMFASFSFQCGYILPLVVGVQGYPCWLTFSLSAMTLCFFNASSFMRNSNFMLMTKLSMATYTYGRIPIDEVAAAEDRMAGLNFHQRIRENLSLILFGLRLTFRINGVTNTPDRAEHTRTLLCLRYITSFWGFLAFFVIIFLPYATLIVVICLTVPVFADGCVGCLPNNPATTYTVVSMGGILLFNAVFFAYKCRALPDVWGVFHEGRLSAIGLTIGFISFLLVSFSSLTHEKYYYNVIGVVGFPLGFFMVTSFQVILARSNEVVPQSNAAHRSKKTNSKAVISSTIVNEDSGAQFPAGSTILVDVKSCPRLNEIVSSPGLLRAFEYHLSTEFGGENLNFLLDTHEWKVAFNDIARSASMARAKKIIGTYVRENGLNQINVSSEMRHELLHASAGEADALQWTLFDRARAEIANLLETGAVMRFVHTKAYSEHVSGNTIIQAVA